MQKPESKLDKSVVDDSKPKVTEAKKHTTITTEVNFTFYSRTIYIHEHFHYTILVLSLLHQLQL